MKHPAPIFRMKAPPRPPPHHLSRLRARLSRLAPPFYSLTVSPLDPRPIGSSHHRARPTALFLEKTHIFRQIGTGLICPKIGQNKPVPKCPRPQVSKIFSGVHKPKFSAPLPKNMCKFCTLRHTSMCKICTFALTFRVQNQIYEKRAYVRAFFCFGVVGRAVSLPRAWRGLRTRSCAGCGGGLFPSRTPG